MTRVRIPASGLLTGRAIPEWVGRTADSKVPDRVKLRVKQRYKNKDAITGLPLVKGWHMDHKTALRDWIKTPEAPHGNRETNLQPVNADVNTAKAALENASRKKITRIQKSQAHIEAPKSPIQSRPFQSRLKPDKSTRISAAHEKHLSTMRQKAGVA